MFSPYILLCMYIYIPDDISPFCSAATPFQYSSSACVLNTFNRLWIPWLLYSLQLSFVVMVLISTCVCRFLVLNITLLSIVLETKPILLYPPAPINRKALAIIDYDIFTESSLFSFFSSSITFVLVGIKWNNLVGIK